MLKISENSLVLCTREFTDIFITFDEIYLVFTTKKVNILYILSSKDDLFINITVSRAFHTVKFELDNERHFHARITINMVYFNGNYLEPLIRKSTISKVL